MVCAGSSVLTTNKGVVLCFRSVILGLFERLEGFVIAKAGKWYGGSEHFD